MTENELKLIAKCFKRWFYIANTENRQDIKELQNKCNEFEENYKRGNECLSRKMNLLGLFLNVKMIILRYIKDIKKGMILYGKY